MIHSFPRYRLQGIRDNKVYVSAETNNSMDDCDNMYVPDFFNLCSYVTKKIKMRKKARSNPNYATYGE